MKIKIELPKEIKQMNAFLDSKDHWCVSVNYQEKIYRAPTLSEALGIAYDALMVEIKFCQNLRQT